MATRLSVVIPTLGRPHLARTLRSVREQHPHEVILVADPAGDLEHVQRVARYFWLHVHEAPSDEHGNGYAQRQHGMTVATGTHLVFLDDDDAWTPGAHAAYLDRACDRPVIFRMDHPQLGVLWRSPTMMFANIGTPMILVPNQPEKLGTWQPHLGLLSNRRTGGGDYRFLIETIEKMGAPLWDERVVCRVRPN